MSLTYGTYVIADLMPSGVTGRKGLGIYQLVFSITFQVPDWPAEKQGRVSSLRATVAAINGRGAIGYMPPAEAEANYYRSQTGQAVIG